MDAPKNGESSRSPSVGIVNELILPAWDTLPNKHVHASMDLISQLHLTPLYNQFVRPYFDPIAETDDEGTGNKKPKRKQGLSKGYVGLLEDCIDPVPLGNNADHSLLPLIGEWLDPPRLPWQPEDDGPITLLSSDSLSSARLEHGQKVDGYAGGEKLGVREAEERRKRKKQARLSQSVAPEFPDTAASPVPAAPSVPPPRPAPGRGTPFRGRGGPPGRGAWPRASAPPTTGRPGTPSGRGGYHGGHVPTPTRGTPGTPSKRPGDAGVGQGPAKRRNLGVHSRSASPAAGYSGAEQIGVKAVFKR